MKHSGYVFIMMLIVGIPLSGQVQYTSAYRSGEGRVERSSQATILVNPVFVQPSVFFSPKGVDTRIKRKWWRNTERMLPKPYNPEQLPASILQKDQLTIDNIKRKKYVSKFPQKPALDAIAVSFSATKISPIVLD